LPRPGWAGLGWAGLGWLERLSRPRLTLFSVGPGEKFAAIFMILATLTIILPLTNPMPSIALSLLAGAALTSVWIFALATVGIGFLMGADWALQLIPGPQPGSWQCLFCDHTGQGHGTCHLGLWLPAD